MKKFQINGKVAIVGLGIILCGLPGYGLKAQADANPLSGWDKKVLKQANTAESATYLSDEEKKLIFYTNLCRLQPKLFCQTVLADYLNSHPNKSPQVASLKKTLNEDKATGVLVPDEELCKMSKDFATKMGKEGKEGHIDFEKRFKPFEKRFMRAGENCDYGSDIALDAFMRLLIDSSDPVNLGHRKNLLDANFKAVGVAGAPHKTYRWNYVMDFGG